MGPAKHLREQSQGFCEMAAAPSLLLDGHAGQHSDPAPWWHICLLARSSHSVWSVIEEMGDSVLFEVRTLFMEPETRKKSQLFEAVHWPPHVYCGRHMWACANTPQFASQKEIKLPKVCIVAHTCNPRTWGAEAGIWKVWGHPGLQWLKATMADIVKPYHPTKKQTNK